MFSDVSQDGGASIFRVNRYKSKGISGAGTGEGVEVGGGELLKGEEQ